MRGHADTLEEFRLSGVLCGGTSRSSPPIARAGTASGSVPPPPDDSADTPWTCRRLREDFVLAPEQARYTSTPIVAISRPLLPASTIQLSLFLTTRRPSSLCHDTHSLAQRRRRDSSDSVNFSLGNRPRARQHRAVSHCHEMSIAMMAHLGCVPPQVFQIDPSLLAISPYIELLPSITANATSPPPPKQRPKRKAAEGT